MVVGASALFTGTAPSTHCAVLDGLGVGARSLRRTETLFEGSLSTPEVRREIGKSIGLRFEVRPWNHDRHELRLDLLYLRQEIGIEAELKDRSRLRVTGELGV